MAGALIVTAELCASDHAWLDRLRREHYPPERNRVPAHLTMFRTLPPSAEAELRSRISEATREPAPPASIEGLLDLGGGVALRVVSSGLDRIRSGLARDLEGLLTPQDWGGWRPHITIQNKVQPKVARALIASLERDFRPRPLGLKGLGLHRYLDGRWEQVAVASFRG